MQTGKKACRIASENGVLFQLIQLGALQYPLFRVDGLVSAQVRKICTKQNLINPRYIAQHAKHGIACRKSRIPIDAPDADNSAARTEPAAPAPTTMKSYRLSSFDSLIILNSQDLESAFFGSLEGPIAPLHKYSGEVLAVPIENNQP